ncbi:Ig-like domain-containing protein [Haloferula sp.]|uniref:Ig-like domain-containing protein n=1 Tax=Haloferula sp. TaxID=2497595 RepID=UPI003C77F90D
MKISNLFGGLFAAYVFLVVGLWGFEKASPAPEPSDGWTLTTWNDLGMHCMDEDFSIFAILPPFNTLNAQLVDKNGDRVTPDGGVQLFYQSAIDPDGSETHSSSSQSNFWEHAEELFGTQFADDTGLFGNRMPGPNNTPQAMHWNSDHRWWTAEGIPIIPKDKWGDDQAYPLVRVTARDSSGKLLAETLVTAPVSSEMNCKTCHASGTNIGARPRNGWVSESATPESDPVRDFRMNILRLHDSKQVGNAVYTAALAEFGYHADGLEASVRADQKAVLCASCHGSNALGTNGGAGISPLTQAMHAGHAGATDPVTSLPLGAATNRASCYQCHPGKETKCLRGAMGRTSDEFGQPLMSCQSCHGGMAAVGEAGRVGWFEEPNCQSCHTGTYTNNAGQVRFTDAFDAPGHLREPADDRFATTPDSPAPGVSLFRFSHGHGGLACSACHGSPHAIYPTSERNDNLQSLAIQGHVGTISECSSCHQNDSNHTRTVTGGPHGMHGVGQWWVEKHHDFLPEVNDRRDTTACQACHGNDSTGGVLSQAFGPRALQSEKGGPITYWQGQRVSCYDCHNGPNESDKFRQKKPVVQNFTITTAAETTAMATLLGTDADTAVLNYRIVEPPKSGTLSILGSQVAYTPNPGFSGTDAFSYCARDNRTDSNLATVSISVGAGASTVDNDHDGIADLVERAFGLSTSRLSRGTAPDYQLYDDGNGNLSIQAVYNPRLIPSDLGLVFEASNDLENWDPDAPNLTTTTDARGNSVVRLAVHANSSTQSFLRCRVESR